MVIIWCFITPYDVVCSVFIIMLRVCILSKTECKSICYQFRRDHYSSSFRKPARNKWICRETCDFFRDENITWNKHIELVENKISKNIGILYRASHYLDKKSLKSIYFSFIHNYVNYCNIAWASTSRTKLDKILKKQKHAVRIIYNKDKFTHSKPLMRDMNALNVYQINIFQVLKFMYKSKHNLNPRVFDNTFTEIHHGYPTKFSRSNFKQPNIITQTTSFAISSREPKIWNNYLHELGKKIIFIFISS